MSAPYGTVLSARRKMRFCLSPPVAASPEEARRLGIMALTLLIGLQQWRQPITDVDFDLVFNEFEELVLRKVPQGA